MHSCHTCGDVDAIVKAVNVGHRPDQGMVSDNTKRKLASVTLPVSAQTGPYAVEVIEGQTYRWCSCGLSATQPWCDDSHAGSDIEPIEFVAPISAVFYMCGCKRSENPPYCFGTCRGHTRVRS